VPSVRPTPSNVAPALTATRSGPRRLGSGVLPARSIQRIARALLCAALLHSSLARAAEDAKPPKPRLEWSQKWPRFRLWEYAGTAAVGLTSLYIRYRVLGTPPVGWQGSNPVDDTVRGWLRAGTPQGRELAGGVSDVLSWGGYMPYAVDLPIVLLGYRKPRLAWQLLMMDFEAAAVAGFLNNGLFYEVHRGRPSVVDCARDPHYDKFCGLGSASSFPSGHVVIVASGAGLACVHHRYLPIYGEAGADAAACVMMSMLTVGTGLARIVADEHYTTDVLTAMVIGFGSGYGLPWLLHYRYGSGGDASDGAAGQRSLALMPLSGGTGRIGLSVIGRL